MEPPRIEKIFTGLDNVFDAVFPFALLVAVLFFIIGGYLWMTSSGDPEKVKRAQGTLTWAILGLIFVLLVSTILDGIIEYIGKL
jgi:hypothetical protein